MFRVCYGLAVVFALAGCSVPEPVSTPFRPAQTGAGLTWPEARQISVCLNPGMTQPEVVRLLKMPDKTELRTQGTSTAKPWAGYIYIYEFRGDYGKAATLNAVFQEDDAGIWRLNYWLWLD